MTTLDELGSLPPITEEVDPFDYVPLDSSREPPPLELCARLARNYDTGEGESEGLRLAFVAGRPVDSYDLLVVSYLWRPASEDVAWGVERWSSPERRLRPYRHDSTFEPRPAAEVHAELKRLGPAGLAEQAQRVLDG